MNNKKMFLKFLVDMHGTWYEKINDDKEMLITKQGELDKYPDKIINEAISKPGEWVEYVKLRRKKNERTN